MSKLRISDFDIGIGWKSPGCYRAVSDWVVSSHLLPSHSEIKRLSKLGILCTLMMGFTILGFYIQIHLNSVSRGRTE